MALLGKDAGGALRRNHIPISGARKLVLSAHFVEFLKDTLAAAAAVSLDGAVHFVCMDWRHIGELLKRDGEIGIMNLSDQHFMQRLADRSTICCGVGIALSDSSTTAGSV